MSVKYSVSCHCSHRVPVELFQAGTSVMCPSCRSDVRVPDSVTLKASSGDKYPLLSHVEKIRRTLEERESPFDGICHGCGGVRADFEVPTTLQTLVERVIADDGGVRLTLTGVKLVAGAAEESWQLTSFPLLLCTQCYAKFQAARSFHRFKVVANNLLLFGLLVAFLVMAYFNFELVAALAGLLWFVGLIAWIIGRRGSNKVDPYLRPWLEKIRWVPEALEDAAEFRITTGDAKRHA